MNNTPTPGDLFPSMPEVGTPARSRRQRSVATAPAPTVRLTIGIELPANAPPPDWLASLLRAQPRAPIPRARPGGESVATWLRGAVTPDPRGRVTLAKLFTHYRACTLASGRLPVSRNAFSYAAVRFIHGEWGSTPSNDIAERGKIRRGFRGLRLVSPPSRTATPRVTHSQNISPDAPDAPG